jgi:hypothetical protein
MKLLTSFFLLLSLLVSCTPEMVLIPAAVISDDVSNSSSSPKAPEKRGINSKYYQGDLMSCVLKTVTLFPITSFIQGLGNLLAPNIEFNLSKRLTDAIKVDLKNYIKKHKYITPDDFWGAISTTTKKFLIKEMIFSYQGLTDEEYATKKQVIAYAFLHYMAAEKEKVAYKFSFDDRRTKGKNHGKFSETISFNGPKLKKDAINLGICGHTRFSDIPTESSAKNSNHDMHLVCVDQSGNYADITRSYQGDYILYFSTDSGVHKIEMDITKIDIDISDNVTKIDYENTRPFYTIELKADYNNLDKIKSLNIEIHQAMLSSGEEFNNLKCRNF